MVKINRLKRTKTLRDDVDANDGDHRVLIPMCPTCEHGGEFLAVREFAFAGVVQLVS
jgi:hypothetical protein